MYLILDNQATLKNISDRVIDEIADRLTLANPAYLEAVKHERWTGNITEKLEYFELLPGGITFPRGFARKAFDICCCLQGQPEVIDNRNFLQELDLSFQGTLRKYQTSALNDILKKTDGVLEAATGSGKTVIAIAAIAQRKQPTLILVHTKELMAQWQERIRQFLNIEPGQIGAGKEDIRSITVGMVQTLNKCPEKHSSSFGHLVVDECHRTPSTTFSKCVTAFEAKYLLGLSATPFRRDGLTKLINIFLGNLVHRVDPKKLRKIGAVLKPEIITRPTEFNFIYDDNYQKMVSALIADPDRNQLIVQDIQKDMNCGDISLVVSDRIEHLETLCEMLGEEEFSAILTGQTPAKQRKMIVENLSNRKIKVLFATTQLIGEGFDCPGLARLYLASPIKFKGKLIQIIGRILRPSENKRPQLYDYVDIQQPVLEAQARYRQSAYKRVA